MILKMSFETFLMLIKISGSTCASSQASSALSTASLIVVITPRVGESNPRRCLFFSKNSATLILRCCFASSSASTMRSHLGDGSRKNQRFLLPGLQVPERHRTGLLLTPAYDNGKIRGLRDMGKLRPEPPLHQVRLSPDTGQTECAGDLERAGSSFLRTDNPDNGV